MPATTKQMTTTKQQAAVSATTLRAEADQRAAAASEATRLAREATAAARAEAAQAAQLAWEASLIDQVQDVQAEYDGASSRLVRLEAGVAAALAAKRAAEDRLNADTRRLAGRKAEQEKARADDAPAERREELAVRVHALKEVIADREAAVAKATQEHVGAVAKLDTCAAHVDGLYAELADAKRKADNPGPAPRQPGPMDDLGGIFQSAITTTIMLAQLATDGLGPGPAKPDRAALMRDQTKFRALNSRVIVPPRMPT
jgi:hypothetical protein